MQLLDEVAIGAAKDLAEKSRIQEVLNDLNIARTDLVTQLDTGYEAQRILGTVADENAERILGRVTSIINSALAEIFPHDVRTIELERKLHGGKHPHINVVLRTSDGSIRDLTLQSGSGLREIISFLYRIILLEVTNKRKLIMMDELLRGVHKDAIRVIQEFMEMFAREGFQFLYVEYGIPEEFGRVYEVIKEGRTARVEQITIDGASEVDEDA